MGVGISVLLINWNSRDDTAACLDSLRRQTDTDFEVVVVDNGSSDGSVEHLREHYPEVIQVEAGENLGFAEGCNRGIARTTQPWIFALNNDTVADPTLIAELRRAIDRGGPHLGMLQPQILLQAPGEERINSTGVLLYGNGVFVDRDGGAPRAGVEASTDVFCVSAGAALYRRAMLEEVRLGTGYFDSTFFMYFEDVDLGWRCRLAGWEAAYVPTAIVRHKFHGSASRRGSRFVDTQCMLNRFRTLIKNASPRFLARTLPLLGKHVAKLTWQGGWPAMTQVVRAISDGARQRGAVDRLRKVDRIAMERRWVLR